MTKGENMKAIAVLASLFALLSGCATVNRDPTLLTYDQSRLPAPDIHVNIAGLGPCTDNPERTLHLSNKHPITLLVHDDHASTGNFRALAEVMARRGQQTACFDYDDRVSLMRSSAQLAAALDVLAAETHNKQLTVIGHGQGALIARKALVAKRPDPLQNKDTRIRLVTISGPFSGITSAASCATPAPWTLGLKNQLCKMEYGEKWTEITPTSDFIKQPGELLNQVQSHLKIVTDEREACRRSEAGNCVEKDYVFSLPEQYFPAVDKVAIVKNIEIKAGHIEIVGDQRIAPVKLIGILQEYGILNLPEAVSPPSDQL
jgi:hypothetical protein